MVGALAPILALAVLQVAVQALTPIEVLVQIVVLVAVITLALIAMENKILKEK